MASSDFRSLLIFSALLRAALIAYGEWQDAHMEVRYTDIDYLVFSDAASYVVSGESPYRRTTYRYSPLLAFLLVPNSYIHPSWGKFLFSAAVFFLFTGLFFHLYKWEFLHEALLYHLTRTDPRHNFSIYFYHIYLHYEYEISVAEKLISFLPQIVVQLVLAFRFALDLPFCLFVQTVAFVAFNKVVTAQYFVWFFCLLPLILPWCKMKMEWQGMYCIFAWMGAQMHWLMWGYLLEFKGKNVFLQLWMANLVFLAANTFVLITIIRYHELCPIFTRPKLYSYQDRKKLE